MPPEVSIIVPTRNRRELLALTLRSVLRQESVNFEVVVVDDGSSDGTSDWIRALGDPRLHVIRHESSRGVSVARNNGVTHARAEHIAFLDDDDLWAPDKLALQLQAARESGRVWGYVGHANVNMRYRVTGGGPPLDPDTLIARLPHSNVVPVGCSGVLVMKDAFLAAGQFDPQLSPLADWDLWIRLARIGPPYGVSRPLVAYRVHGTQISLDSTRVQAEFDIMAARYGAGNRAILYQYLGWGALRVKSHGNALRFFSRAFLQRRPEYSTRVFCADLAWLTRDILQHRLGIAVAAPVNAKPSSEAIESWRAQAQAWVDALLASPDPFAGSLQTAEPPPQ
jgi:glycosyltransferase involved in cell wall biosynthesis